jgi:hypothetical protein
VYADEKLTAIINVESRVRTRGDFTWN